MEHNGQNEHRMLHCTSFWKILDCPRRLATFDFSIPPLLGFFRGIIFVYSFHFFGRRKASAGIKAHSEAGA